MLRLGAITNNPLATTAIWWFGIAVIVGLAVVAIGVWIVVVQGGARRATRDFEDSANDPELETLRHERLVVTSADKEPGQPDAVISELEQIDAPEPPGSGPAGQSSASGQSSA